MVIFHSNSESLLIVDPTRMGGWAGASRDTSRSSFPYNLWFSDISGGRPFLALEFHLRSMFKKEKN